MKASKQAYQRLALENNPYKRLVREERWLDACRTHHGTSLESYLPLAFSENIQPHETIDVIHSFVSLVNSGITPPAHILAAVAAGFEHYLKVGKNAIDKGKEPISLDKAFKLNPKQSVGHALKHRREKQKRGNFVYKMLRVRKIVELRTGKRISKNDAFIQVAAEYKTEPYTEEAMLKEYFRLKVDDVFANVSESLEETNRLAATLSEKNSRILEEMIKKFDPYE